MGQGKPLNTIDSLLARCERTSNGCLEWTGCRARSGHGRISWRRQGAKLVHRVVWEALVGEIPDGAELHHICKNPACCDIRHLKLVTRKEHAAEHDELREQRAWRGQLTHCKRGHEFTSENTRIDSRGQRQCRQCRRDHNRKWMAENFRRLPSYQKRRAGKEKEDV